jgi:hypothetical protein
MLDEDSNFTNYLSKDSGGKRGLETPIDEDWANVQHFTKFLQVLYDVTVKISGSLYSTSNTYFSTLQKVYNCLTKYCDSDDILLSTMEIKMKSKYDKYWGDFEKIIPLFVAFVLDPHYKIEVLEFWFMSNVGEGKTKKIVSNLKNVLNQLYNHYAMNVGGSGARLSNEGRSCTSSTSFGVGSGTRTSNKVEKYALKDYH